MTAQTEFRRLMALRRATRDDASEWAWITRAARQLVWIMAGVPASEWPNV